jgi:hypothetical protein
MATLLFTFSASGLSAAAALLVLPPSVNGKPCAIRGKIVNALPPNELRRSHHGGVFHSIDLFFNALLGFETQQSEFCVKP